MFKQFEKEHKNSEPLKKCFDELIELGYLTNDEKEKYFKKDYFFKCNMFIMPKKCFLEYGKYLNCCLNILIKMIDGGEFQTELNPRLPGFTFERLTGFWLDKLFVDKKYNVIPTKISR